MESINQFQILYFTNYEFRIVLFTFFNHIFTVAGISAMDAVAWIQINYVVWAKKMTWKTYLTRSRIGISPHWMWLWPTWLSWRKEFSEMSKLCLRLSYHQVDCRLKKFNSKIMHSKVPNKHAVHLLVFHNFHKTTCFLCIT